MFFKKNKFSDPKYPFRKAVAKPAPLWRIEKYSKWDLKDFKVIHAYTTLFFRPASYKETFSFIWSVITQFFLLQYFQKIRLTHYPIKHVDHELDEKVPFRPEKIKVYLEFINIWIHPLVMLIRRFNSFEGSKLAAEFMCYIKENYKSAAVMYRKCMTTTYRPKCPSSKALTNVQRADPHYLCVPSLHIATVCLCYSFYKMIFKRENFTKEESEKWYNELYFHAVEIGETVLYVKQHSVNCIPAALYMITKNYPELFTPEMGIEYINDLFKNSTDIAPEDKKKINEHIKFTYEKFLLEGIYEKDWTVPVERWLADYKNYTPFYADK